MSSEALERAEEIRVVLDDVSGAAVASDTRVHLARAALDALLAEVARLEEAEGAEMNRGDTQFERADRAEAALAVAREREQRLLHAIKAAMRELGVPGVGYPAPVANAVEILRAALVDEPAAATSSAWSAGSDFAHPAAAIGRQAVDDYRQDLATLAEPEHVEGEPAHDHRVATSSGSASAAADETDDPLDPGYGNGLTI